MSLTAAFGLAEVARAMGALLSGIRAEAVYFRHFSSGATVVERFDVNA
jgi:hypothetical protein